MMLGRFLSKALQPYWPNAPIPTKTPGYQRIAIGDISGRMRLIVSRYNTDNCLILSTIATRGQLKPRGANVRYAAAAVP